MFEYATYKRTVSVVNLRLVAQPNDLKRFSTPAPQLEFFRRSRIVTDQFSLVLSLPRWIRIYCLTRPTMLFHSIRVNESTAIRSAISMGVFDWCSALISHCQ